MTLRSSQILHAKPRWQVSNPEESFLRSVRQDLQRGLLRDVHGRRLVLMSLDETELRLKERGTVDV